ncbi:MAG: S8 family serine peptidase [Phycisphaeraceae bacterium]|nr:S8 family serine peptidase [Phycisphaeraceae bacterium]
MRTHHVKATSVALALTLCAGMAYGAGALAVSSSKSGSTLMLDGAGVYSTSNSIVRHRLIPMTGSKTVVATWDEVNGGARTSFFAISLDGKKFDQVQPTDYKLRLRYATFDPLQGLPAVPEALKAPKNNELFIVQFVSTPLDEMRRDIQQLGGVVEATIPDQGHLIRMNARTRERVAQLPYVRWVGPCEVAYRLPEELRATILNAAPDAGAVRYSIACRRDGLEQQTAVADAIAALGGLVEHITPDMFRMEATLTPAQLLAVAQRNEIDTIDLWGGPGGTDMDIARQIGGAVPILSTAGFLGQGVRGEVHDTETQSNHPEWNNPNIYVQHATNGSSGFHGSACYGINFAAGVSPAATGMLPQREAGIFFWYTRSSQFTAGQPSRLAMNTEAVDPAGIFRSSYQTSSVGSTQISSYTTISQETDDYLFKIDYLSCQSQSNTGNTNSRPQAWAKNIVSVGGVNHQNTLTRADDAVSGASYGPAQDGRQKPDLWHFYDNITTTNNSSGYTTFSGTSGATPITAGHFGLLMQMWHQGVWAGFGGASSVFASRPFSTTAKALMINGAYKYNPLSTYPRARQGWGMADLGYLYNIRSRTFIVNADDPVGNAQTKTYNISVAPAEAELRVTMCYIDPSPSGIATPNRVNDLSLRVTAPNGTVYWGNNGLTSSNFSTAGGSANTVDTVENVFIANPMAGQWTVEVIGASITQDAYPTGYAGVTPTGPTDAGFSLVVTGGVGVAPPSGCYANCDQSTGAPLLTANDFQCFLNKFAAGDTYANCDQSTGSPLLTANDFQCFLNKFAAGCT